MPFAASMAGAAYSIVNEEQPATLFRTDIPDGLSAVITKCLEGSTERYQTADEVVRDLRNLARETLGAVNTLRERALKTHRSLRLLLWWSGVRGVFPHAGFSSHQSQHKNITVLPFLNMSSDPNQEYFSKGSPKTSFVLEPRTACHLPHFLVLIQGDQY